jgi:polysaccharide pyruvyl transferase CsaB
VTPRRSRVVALGYQGFGNVGDEAILGGIEELLRDEAVDVTTIIGGPAPIAAFASARRIASRRLVPTPRTLLALARADALLVTGGGLLHDHFPVVVPRYLAWTLAARVLRCRVVWVGVGIGPLRRGSSRRLAALALRLSHLVLVRDESSAALAREIGGRVDGVIPDPALFLAPPAWPASLASPASAAAEEGLAVVVREPISDPAAADRLVRVLADLLAEAAAAGRPASILTFAGARDRAIAIRIADAVGERGHPRPRIDELAPDHRAALDRLAQASLVVTVRLHGMILAAVAARPFVAVAYDPKVQGVAGELDAADLVIPLETLTAATLDAGIERAGDPARRGRIAARVAALRERRGGIGAEIGTALRGER